MEGHHLQPFSAKQEPPDTFLGDHKGNLFMPSVVPRYCEGGPNPVPPPVDPAGDGLNPTDVYSTVFCKVENHIGEQEGDALDKCGESAKPSPGKKTLKPSSKKAHGERQFSCSECGKNFMRGADLAKHLRTHLGGVRAYVCNACGKCFRRNTSLIIHERIHTGERPYECVQCGKSFIQRQHLTTHQKIHTGVRPFQCIECGKGFRWRSELIKHQKIHTEKATDTFDDIAASFPKEEWMEFEEWQKELYRNVMRETSETLISLGEGLIDKALSEKSKGPEKVEPPEALNGESQDHVYLSAQRNCTGQASECHHNVSAVVQPGNPIDCSDAPLLALPNNPKAERMCAACAECGKIFYNKKTLKAHLQAHSGERTFICNVCGKCFRRHTSLQIHERIHTGERPYQCGQCGKSFIQRQHLTTHLKIHTGVRAFHCSECGKGFRWKSELLKHERVHVQQAAPLNASVLDLKKERNDSEEQQKEGTAESFQSTTVEGQEKLKPDPQGPEEAETPESSGTSKASTTGKPVTSRSGKGILKPARPKAPKVDRTPAECAECGKIFYNKRTLKTHLHAHSGERSYICNVCGKCFRRHTSLQIHERIHTGERPYKCTQCGKTFIQRQHLTTHLKIHTGERAFHCSDCGKGFRWKSELLKHERVHLEKASDTSVKVETRGKRATRSRLANEKDSGKGPELRTFSKRTKFLRRHKQLKGEKAQTCADCGKNFLNKRTLRAHQRVHTGERSYICNVCGKSFRRHTSLLIHERIHTGERPYQCAQCGKTFIQRQHLTTHQKIHTGERAFHCPACGKGFRWRSELLKHQSVHTEQPPPGSGSGRRCRPLATWGDATARKGAMMLSDSSQVASEAQTAVPFPKKECIENTGGSQGDEKCSEDPALQMHCSGDSRHSDPLNLEEERPPNGNVHGVEPSVSNDGGIGSINHTTLLPNIQAGDELHNSAIIGGSYMDQKSLPVTPQSRVKERLFPCTQCERSFVRSYDLMKHQRNHKSERPYICNACGKCFRRNTSLIIHERIHTGERPYQCAQCGKSFIQRQHLTTHLKTHTGERPFPCVQCGKSFRWRSELVKHQRVHIGEVPVTFDDIASCFSEEWKDLEEWQKELYKNMMKENSEALMQLAGEGWMNKNGKEHLPKDLDRMDNQEACLGSAQDHGQPCSERERNSEGQAGEGLGDEQAPSTDYGQGFSIQGEHVLQQRIHSGEGTHASTDSGTILDLGSHLMERQKIVREKPFPCTECERTFARSSDLIKHQRAHRGDRPYVCNACGKCFRRNTSLIIHKRIHTGERPYKCKECGKSFVQRQHLTTHLKTHTGERPYPCPECEKGFRWRSELVKHQKVHEAADPLQGTEYTRG
ncbi:zinc finger protein 585A-like isoform X2 [Ambystoma mexicanum]|uniref:zinc finger protein 585A-like isoform X2 n=1 Tax=Ambystoma mexicanum TaxID=8296 RepID=UPI0037E9505B